MVGEFHVSAMSEGLLLFQCPSEEAKCRILAKGPWSLARQLLALEPWRPKFRPGWDTVTQLRVWIRLPDLPLELWEERKILKIIGQAGTPLFLDDWMLNSTRLGYARVCVLMDANRLGCPGTRIQVHDEVIWQQFTYEELPDICYTCGCIGVPQVICDCSGVQKVQNMEITEVMVFNAKANEEEKGKGKLKRSPTKSQARSSSASPPQAKLPLQKPDEA
uniref:Uncharacterized protein LOC105037227 n=1 Tax=Elaeis guineensis var. tenera TaxID=51953 RepID=A0A6I9QKZ9_ELAGV|nr:uncharacterized protein LOC105037227 [Elaeis guineensis]